MYTPPGKHQSSPYDGMPPLVDPNGFIPPPPGVSQGGSGGAGFFGAFPGAVNGGQNGFHAPNGTPYPFTSNGLPTTPWGGYSPFVPPPPTSAPPGGPSWAWSPPSAPNPFPNSPGLAYPAFTHPSGYPATSAPGLGAPNPNAGGYVPWGPPNLNYTAYPHTPDGITAGGFFGASSSSPPQTHGGGAPPVGLNFGWDLTTPNTPSKSQKQKQKKQKKTMSAPTTPAHDDTMLRSRSWGGHGDATNAMGLWGVGGGGYPAWGVNPAQPVGPSMPLWPAHEPFGPKDLAKRPKDWRSDYQPRGGFAGVFGAFRSKSSTEEYTDNKARTLHPLLQYNVTNPPIEHDLREHPFDPPSPVFTNMGRPPNQIDFAQLTTQPSCSMMRVYHPNLPWFIDVKPQHPNGVTIYDVFLQIWTQLSQPIRGRDFFNDELTDGDREGITRSWWERCGGNTASPEYSRGVCQIDFLGRKCILQGFVRGKGGNWEMKCAKADPPD